ncbi:hypothetical protein [Parvimonas micra]|uniref:Uncharacterized protein n=1 Tax=Parvimonas micra TaxID=33033 RepID=A0A9X3HBJ5_9FIRM|nr:hypothetical protein [Parvimonas micra]MCZ7407679.1 hypothetical protein [Parvimonas micra]MCZ7410674.1 hypothetical protein [Parvimonas micra]MCZ7412604.1 hypothetical protein [Parvimonas micra]WBB36339.1 hypothetical protein NM218_04565 [Parvimonas micra]
MKKILKLCLLTLMITLSMSSVSFAGFQYLWRISSGTYVSTYHADDYFALYYYGTASVRGTDRGYDSKTGYKSYYTWTQITYLVPGYKPYRARAYSRGKNDSVARVKKIKVKDTLLPGKKTRALYDYGTAWVDTKPGPIPSRKVKNNLSK